MCHPALSRLRGLPQEALSSELSSYRAEAKLAAETARWTLGRLLADPVCRRRLLVLLILLDGLREELVLFLEAEVVKVLIDLVDHGIHSGVVRHIFGKVVAHQIRRRGLKTNSKFTENSLGKKQN